MADHALTEPFEAMGDWFLPGNRDHQVSGVLSYGTEQTELRLNAPLEPMPQTVRFGIDDHRKYPTVYGFTNAAEAVTVLGATQPGSSFVASSGGFRTPTCLYCNVVIIGGHVASEALYTEMLCRIPGLEAWLSPQSIHKSYHDGRFSLSTADRLAEPFPVHQLDGGLIFRTSNEVAFGAHSASIQNHGHVCLEPREPQRLDWYCEQLPKITSLITLLAGSPMTVDKITLATGMPGQLLSVLAHQYGAKYCSFTQEFDFFLPRSAISEHIAEILNKWLSLYPKVQSACGLALSVINSYGLWPHVEFLSLMQALEGLHRSLYPGTYMDADDYADVRDTLVKAIPEKVSSSHRSALCSRIKYGNEVALRKRIQKLVECLSPLLQKAVFGDEGAALEAWLATRNYYTHWDDALRSQILGTDEMHYAGVRLKMFLRTLYLQLAGVSEDALVAALNNNSDVSRHLKAVHAMERRAV